MGYMTRRAAVTRLVTRSGGGHSDLLPVTPVLPGRNFTEPKSGISA